MIRWLLVRHAETPWNRAGRIQGHTDIPLSENGLQQAQALREHLSRWQIQAAYASDLTRTMQTAEAALAGRGISPTPTPELREFAYGQWEGMTYKEVEAQYPEEYAEMLKRVEDFAPPGGGESLRDMMARIGGFVSRTKQAHSDDDTILVTGHGGSLRALLTCLMGLAPHTSWQFMLTPASLSIVDCYPGVGVLRLLNDTSHIGGQA